MGYDSKKYPVYTNNHFEYKYAMDHTTFLQFTKDIITGAINWTSLTDFFSNNDEYVMKAMFLPLNLESTGIGWIASNKTNTMSIGQTTFDLTQGIFTTYNVKEVWDYQINYEWFSFKPTRSHNNFLDFEPYTKFTLQCPFFEKIELNPILIYGKTIKGDLQLDLNSGHATLYIYADGVLLDSKSCQLGINLPLGSTNMTERERNQILQAISVIGGIGATAVGVASGNPLITAGGVAGMTSTVVKGLSTNVDHLKSYKGGSGIRDMLCVDKTIYLIKETVQNVTRPSASLVGRMLNEDKTLSSITGYTEVDDIHFNPSNYDIYDDEIREIEELLKSGVIL